MGKKADNFNKDGIPSLLEAMKSKGVSPFDLTNSKGWVKLYITGSGINTEYHIEPAQVEKEDETKDGRKIKYMDDFVGEVHPHILSDEVDLSEIPNVVEFEKKFAFTVEESLTFVKEEGTLAGVPEKFRKKGNQSPDVDTESGEAEVTEEAGGEYQQASESDIPY
jgi:hypothetical protein